jgi:16S rRNA U516 pseudouridylate synthase RsuA-like enzyme
MLAELGFEVLRLIRVRVGKVELGNLKPGESRQLTLDDIHGKPKPKW